MADLNRRMALSRLGVVAAGTSIPVAAAIASPPAISSELACLIGAFEKGEAAEEMAAEQYFVGRETFDNTHRALANNAFQSRLHGTTSIRRRARRSSRTDRLSARII